MPVVDLSEAKPNILYEAGYAHALNKPCIYICSTSTDKLHLDVSRWKTRCIIRAQTHKLAKDTRLIENLIKKAIGAMIVFTGAPASAPTCALEKIWRRSSSKEIILKQPSA